MPAHTPAPMPAWQHDDRALAHLALTCLDLTELGDACQASDVDALCGRAQGRLPGQTHPSLPAVAAVCVWPAFVAQARQQLPASIRVAAVVNFPHGDQSVASVVAQIEQVRAAGGQEIDCVLPYRDWLAGRTQAAEQLLQAVRQSSHGLTLKLILESGAFDDLTLLHQACNTALDLGVDFLKTSTGKIAQGASPEAAQVLLSALRQHPNSIQRGFKPSGGLRSVADTRPYLLATQQHLGAAALTSQRFRIGASSLWKDAARLLAGPTASDASNAPSSSY